MASSGQYLMNDLIDAETDRAHPIKRARPVAAGELSAGAAAGSLRC
jgi:decaprenyl-phosphate phosphoribosyltransferase